MCLCLCAFVGVSVYRLRFCTTERIRCGQIDITGSDDDVVVFEALEKGPLPTEEFYMFEWSDRQADEVRISSKSVCLCVCLSVCLSVSPVCQSCLSCLSVLSVLPVNVSMCQFINVSLSVYVQAKRLNSVGRMMKCEGLVTGASVTFELKLAGASQPAAHGQRWFCDRDPALGAVVPTADVCLDEEQLYENAPTVLIDRQDPISPLCAYSGENSCLVYARDDTGPTHHAANLYSDTTRHAEVPNSLALLHATTDVDSLVSSGVSCHAGVSFMRPGELGGSEFEGRVHAPWDVCECGDIDSRRRFCLRQLGVWWKKDCQI